MRDFLDLPTFAFQDFSQFCPPLEEGFRVRESEASSSSFFCWSQKNDTYNSVSPPINFGDSTNTTATAADYDGPLFPTFFSNTQSVSDADQLVHPVAQPSADHVNDDDVNVITDFDYSALANILLDPSNQIKVKEEQGQANNINYSVDQSACGQETPSFPSFQSFQDVIKEPAYIHHDNLYGQEPFQLFGRPLDECPMQPCPPSIDALAEQLPASESSNNLQKIIDACISFEPSFLPSNRDPSTLFDIDLAQLDDGELRMCRWMGCELSFPSQEQLVSTIKGNKIA